VAPTVLEWNLRHVQALEQLALLKSVEL